jgi:hypothetical protein
MAVEEPGAQLPGREPRPLFVHMVIDSIVAFLLIVIVLLILDVSIWVTAGLAIGVGIGVAPFTRRAEIAALEERESGSDSA